MLKIHRAEGASMKSGKMSQLKPIPFNDANAKERELQELLVNSWEDFMAEIGEKLFLVGQEIKPSPHVDDRIDLLAFDADGTAVIIELKRGSNKWQIAQGLCYAAMVSEWTPDMVEKALKEHAHSMDELEKYVGPHVENINQTQRIILIAEDYDYEVLITAKCLSEHALQVSCWQVTMARDPDGPRDYLSFVQVFPHKKLEALAIQRGRQRIAAMGELRTIEQRLEECENEAEKEYFSQRLGTRRNSKGDALALIINGVIRWYVTPSPEWASVYQVHRFDGDENTWIDMLEDPQLSKLQRGDLRFRLKTRSDFEKFQQFVEQKGKDLFWFKPPASNDGVGSAISLAAE